jgi:hypothetical protein
VGCWGRAGTPHQVTARPGQQLLPTSGPGAPVGVHGRGPIDDSVAGRHAAANQPQLQRLPCRAAGQLRAECCRRRVLQRRVIIHGGPLQRRPKTSQIPTASVAVQHHPEPLIVPCVNQALAARVQRQPPSVVEQLLLRRRLLQRPLVARLAGEVGRAGSGARAEDRKAQRELRRARHAADAGRCRLEFAARCNHCGACGAVTMVTDRGMTGRRGCL